MSSDNLNRLVEYHKVRMFDPNLFQQIEKLYEKLLPPWEEPSVLEISKVVESRPTVQPCVRRKRKPQPLNIPKTCGNVVDAAVSVTCADHSIDCSHIPIILPSPTSSPLTDRLVHKPVESDYADTMCSMGTKIETRMCSVVLVDLKSTNLATFINPMVGWYNAQIAKISESRRICDRKESTDSGVATDEEYPRPPIKITLVRTVDPKRGKVSSKRSRRRPAKYKTSEKPRRQKDKPLLQQKCSSTASDPTPVPEQPRKRPRVRTKLHSNVHSQRPRKSISVSLPLTDHIKLIADTCIRRRFLDDFEHQGVINTTSLPKAAIPTQEFDVSKVEMAPLAKKRYEDPPPYQFSVLCDGAENMCITCNKHFNSKHDLGSHHLANHPSTKPVY